MRGIREEDIAIQENGPIADRTKEHLGTSDAGVIALRRRLLKAARYLQAGREPSQSTTAAGIACTRPPVSCAVKFRSTKSLAPP